VKADGSSEERLRAAALTNVCVELARVASELPAIVRGYRDNASSAPALLDLPERNDSVSPRLAAAIRRPASD
jgi:hypothetical protein